MRKDIEDLKNNQLRAVEILRILSNRNGITILERILIANTCICGEFIGSLALSAQELAEQLKRMINTGILQGRVDGAKICYCLSPDIPVLVENLLGKQLAPYTAHLHCNEC